MFFLRRPSKETIEQFLEESRNLPLSYADPGLAGTAHPDFDLDETVVLVGHGDEAYERAKNALVSWAHFGFDWVDVIPRTPSIEPGRVVAVLIRHLGFWSLNGCRIVYVVGDRSRGWRFGFAYGTLSNHAERGEEIFEVFRMPETGEVGYRIRAASRPGAALARVGYPIVRVLQARFRRDSAEAMRRAVDAAVPGRVE
jgi:uncharacterized protein (UPF0548 family)